MASLQRFSSYDCESRNAMKRILAMPWILIVCWTMCQPLLAIDPDRRLDQLYHTAWTAKDGAPTTIYTWAQTPDGFLWFGNLRGLFRFDGARFERYDVLSGVATPKAGVLALATLPDGSLLIGWFHGGGVSRLKDGKFTDYGGPGSGLPPNEAVLRFQMGGDASLWALVGYTGIFRLDESGHWHRIGSELPIHPTLTMPFYADRQGTLWVGTDKQMFFLRRGETTFHEIRGGGTVMTQSPDGTLWLQSPGSIRTIDENGMGAEIMTAPPKEPFGMCIFADSEGSMWSGCNGKGILRIEHPANRSAGKVTVEKFMTDGGLTQNIFQDHEGNVWVTTGRGIESFRQSNVVPVKFPTSSTYAFLDGSAEDVRVISYFPGVVWTIKNGSVAGSRPWAFKTVYVYHGKNEVTWLGTEDRGLVKVVKDQGRPVDTPGVPVGAIAEDEKGRVWAEIGGKGLLGLENGKWRTATELGGPPQRAVSSFTDSKARTWFGLFDNQVAMMAHDKFSTFGVKEGVRVGICTGIQEADGAIFIGGEHALEMFDGRNFLPVVPNDREAFEEIWSLLASDRSGLWFAEKRGLVHIPISEIRQLKSDTRRKVSYEIFDLQDGLSSALQRSAYRPSSFESPDGRIWFATETGVVWIDPNQMVHNAVAPGVAVDSITVNGKAYNFFSPLTLPARTTSLRIAFTAASMTIPERVRFRFKLDGVDKDWQDAGTRRETTYTNLDPGSYRFQVIACNSDGVWNEAGAVSNFGIAPTFYQTSWFRALCVLMAVLLMAAAYRFRVRQIATAINARFNERLMERGRIARDLHDTLLQSFHGLMLHFQIVNNLLPEGEAKEELEKTLDRADRAIAESRSAVYDLRASATDSSDLSEALNAAGNELSGDHGTAFNLTVEGAIKDLRPIIRDELYRIAREALTNAFRHAHARHIEVEISYGPQAFRLRIRDDGEGIPSEVLDHGRAGHFGLPGMRERAKQIGADLTIWSRPGTGSEIDLSLAGKIVYATLPRGFWFRRFQQKS
jgi:signal transduction histidine kinase/ligand-binding sensor domain-containing protein